MKPERMSVTSAAIQIRVFGGITSGSLAETVRRIPATSRGCVCVVCRPQSRSRNSATSRRLPALSTLVVWLAVLPAGSSITSTGSSATQGAGVKVFFAAPHSPWQRGTNENTNGLLRQYSPKGTDLSRWSAREIQAVATALNTRPRQTLGWKTPAEALDEHLKSVQQSRVATTG